MLRRKLLTVQKGTDPRLGVEEHGWHMPETRAVTETVVRPSACPFCGSNRFDTLAKVITVNTWWRCRECEATWSIASQQAASPRTR